MNQKNKQNKNNNCVKQVLFNNFVLFSLSQKFIGSQSIYTTNGRSTLCVWLENSISVGSLTCCFSGFHVVSSMNLR